jgi:hypothetical protein
MDNKRSTDLTSKAQTIYVDSEHRKSEVSPAGPLTHLPPETDLFSPSYELCCPERQIKEKPTAKR